MDAQKHHTIRREEISDSASERFHGWLSGPDPTRRRALLIDEIVRGESRLHGASEHDQTENEVRK